MARARGIRSGGGVLRFLERTGVSRGVFGASRGWFYVGVGLWTLRKVRTLGAGGSEVLISEELRPGQRLVIANGVATIEEAPGSAPTEDSRGRRGRRARRASRRAERGRGRAADAGEPAAGAVAP